MKRILYCIAVTALFLAVSSCKDSSTGDLKEERDSLANVNNQQKMVLDDLTSTLIEVSLSIDSISMVEKNLMKSGEGKALTKKQMLANLSSFKNLLAAKKKKLNELETSLSARNDQLSKMSTVIKFLNEELEKKEAMIQNLQSQLEQKNVDISKLRTEVGNMTTTISSLESVNEEQSNTIKEQAVALNSVYYVIGTNKELQSRNIIRKDGLFSKKRVDYKSLDKQYFTRGNAETLHEIDIEGKSPRILTGMPDGSYRIISNSKTSHTLQIIDPSLFWSVSKYLIIQVK